MQRARRGARASCDCVHLTRCTAPVLTSCPCCRTPHHTAHRTPGYDEDGYGNAAQPAWRMADVPRPGRARCVCLGAPCVSCGRWDASPHTHTHTAEGGCRHDHHNHHNHHVVRLPSHSRAEAACGHAPAHADPWEPAARNARSYCRLIPIAQLTALTKLTVSGAYGVVWPVMQRLPQLRALALLGSAGGASRCESLLQDVCAHITGHRQLTAPTVHGAGPPVLELPPALPVGACRVWSCGAASSTAGAQLPGAAARCSPAVPACSQPSDITGDNRQGLPAHEQLRLALEAERAAEAAGAHPLSLNRQWCRAIAAGVPAFQDWQAANRF
jgi:hypothetical protein